MASRFFESPLSVSPFRPIVPDWRCVSTSADQQRVSLLRHSIHAFGSLSNKEE